MDAVNSEITACSPLNLLARRVQIAVDLPISSTRYVPLGQDPTLGTRLCAIGENFTLDSSTIDDSDIANACISFGLSV
jgi:hypothetical protein